MAKYDNYKKEAKRFGKQYLYLPGVGFGEDLMGKLAAMFIPQSP